MPHTDHGSDHKKNKNGNAIETWKNSGKNTWEKTRGVNGHNKVDSSKAVRGESQHYPQLFVSCSSCGPARSALTLRRSTCLSRCMHFISVG